MVQGYWHLPICVGNHWHNCHRVRLVPHQEIPGDKREKRWSLPSFPSLGCPLMGQMEVLPRCDVHDANSNHSFADRRCFLHYDDHVSFEFCLLNWHVWYFSGFYRSATTSRKVRWRTDTASGAYISYFTFVARFTYSCVGCIPHWITRTLTTASIWDPITKQPWKKLSECRPSLVIMWVGSSQSFSSRTFGQHSRQVKNSKTCPCLEQSARLSIQFSYQEVVRKKARQDLWC